MEVNINTLFSEVNEHMRNTENKYIQVSSAYIALVGILIPIVFTSSHNFFNGDINNIIIFIAIYFISKMIYSLQQWFRVWKEHYLEVASEIMKTSKIHNALKPHWLRNETLDNNLMFNFDNLFSYFTFTFGFLVLIAIPINLYYIVSMPYVVLGTAVISIVHIIITKIVNKKISYSVELIA